MFDSMTPDTLLTELNTRGIVLRRAGHRLMVKDPGKMLTPELSTLIKLYKPILLEQLNHLPAARLRVEVWPTGPARYNLLMRLLSDSRCIEFYASGAALGEAIDRADPDSIALAQARFNQALVNARVLADEITSEMPACLISG